MLNTIENTTLKTIFRGLINNKPRSKEIEIRVKKRPQRSWWIKFIKWEFPSRVANINPYITGLYNPTKII